MTIGVPDLFVSFIPAEGSDEVRVLHIVSLNPDVKTDTGIGLGSTAADVRAKYPAAQVGETSRRRRSRWPAPPANSPSASRSHPARRSPTTPRCPHRRHRPRHRRLRRVLRLDPGQVALSAPRTRGDARTWPCADSVQGRRARSPSMTARPSNPSDSNGDVVEPGAGLRSAQGRRTRPRRWRKDPANGDWRAGRPSSVAAAPRSRPRWRSHAGGGRACTRAPGAAQESADVHQRQEAVTTARHPPAGGGVDGVGLVRGEVAAGAALEHVADVRLDRRDVGAVGLRGHRAAV